MNGVSYYDDESEWHARRRPRRQSLACEDVRLQDHVADLPAAIVGAKVGDAVCGHARIEVR